MDAISVTGMSLSIISPTHVDSNIVPHNIWYNIAINYYVFNMYAESKSVYGPHGVQWYWDGQACIVMAAVRAGSP